MDNRVATMTSSGGSSAAFVYDGDGKRVKRIENGLTTTVFIGGFFELNLSTTLTATYYFANSKPIAQRRGGVLYFLQGDHLGSVSLTTDVSGNPVFQARYSAFGGTRAAASGTPVADDEAVAFTGQIADRADGWIYFYGARIYDPNIGRFLSADTVVPSAGNPQAFNRYSYTKNNPLRYIDPTGHINCIPEIGECDGGVIEIGGGGGNFDLQNDPQFQQAAADQATYYSNLQASEQASIEPEEAAANVDTAGQQTNPGNDILQPADSSRGSNLAASDPGMCSFSGPTIVETPNGPQPISNLRPGDLVRAYNQTLGTTGNYTVTAVWVHLDPVIVVLTLHTEQIETTPEHPFYTAMERGLALACSGAEHPSAGRTGNMA